MAVYKEKYILKGLKEITPEMEKDLDLAYGICMQYRKEQHCEMCGKCCHQPNIIILPEEIDRIAYAANIPLHIFIRDNIERTSGGDLFFKKTDPCCFLTEENKCRIWKDRPAICDDFPYMVSLFMSRVYLAITNDDADIMDLLSYMDDTWPCNTAIKSSISEKIAEAKSERMLRINAVE